MWKVTFEFLDSAIDDLYNTIWLKDNLSHYIVYSIYADFGIKWLCEKIANQLWLNVNFDIKFTTWNEFKTTQLHTKSEWDAWICAQVQIPDNIGDYNFETIKWYIISIKISPDIEYNDILGLSVIVAHELSHIVLHLTKHAQRENEYYTDLTAMMLWFNEIYYNWRKKTKETDSYVIGNTRHTSTHTTTYWYLDDIDFKYASNKIQFLLDQDKVYRAILKKRRNYLEKTTNKLLKYINTFNKSLTNTAKNIWKSDIIKLQKYYDITYIQDYETLVYKSRSIINKINDLLIKNCKTKKWLYVITESIKNIEAFTEKIGQKKKELKNDIMVINLSQYKNPLVKFFKHIFLILFY